MTISLRIFLIMGAGISCVYVLQKIRNSKMQTENSLFWFLFSLVLVLLGIFPGIAVRFAEILGVQSPVNLVYLIVIFLLVIKCFLSDQKSAKIESRLTNFIQKYAVDQKEHDKREEKESGEST